MTPREQTNRIVIHHSASPDVSAETIREWHTKGNGWADIGYHYVVRQDGSVELGREHSIMGAHAKGRNNDSIGICVTGNDEFTMEQYCSVAILIRSINGTYNKKLIIEEHHSACPGKGFAWEMLETLGVR